MANLTSPHGINTSFLLVFLLISLALCAPPQSEKTDLAHIISAIKQSQNCPFPPDTLDVAHTCANYSPSDENLKSIELDLCLGLMDSTRRLCIIAKADKDFREHLTKRLSEFQPKSPTQDEPVAFCSEMNIIDPNTTFVQAKSIYKRMMNSYFCPSICFGVDEGELDARLPLCRSIRFAHQEIQTASDIQKSNRQVQKPPAEEKGKEPKPNILDVPPKVLAPSAELRPASNAAESSQRGVAESPINREQLRQGSVPESHIVSEKLTVDQSKPSLRKDDSMKDKTADEPVKSQDSKQPQNEQKHPDGAPNLDAQEKAGQIEAEMTVKDPEKDLEKDPEKNPEKDPEKDPERDPEKDPERDPEKDPERDPEKDSEKNPEKDNGGDANPGADDIHTDSNGLEPRDDDIEGDDGNPIKDETDEGNLMKDETRGNLPNKPKDLTNNEEFKISQERKETFSSMNENPRNTLMATAPEESHFFVYFMALSALVVLGYLVYHNKRKIIAMAVEGKKGRNTGRRRPNSANYHKLDSNLEEAMSSNIASTNSYVIY